VINLLFGYSRFPWIALLLAISMGFYGLVRKKVAVDALPGLTMECLLLSPVAVGYLVALHRDGELVFGSMGAGFDLLLACSALMTALPLILFTSATRILRLGTVGLLQYLNPTCQFLLAVLLFREPFTQTHLITFLLIWSGLILFTLDSRKGRSAR
jgi:chloramphenicol-sensitive protein RarD